MKKKYLSVLCTAALLGSMQLNAQLAPYYSFTQLQGTYTAITGGTVFGTSNDDDESYVDPANPQGALGPQTGPGLPIGFTFNFNNTNYDVIGISNNGWITLGQSALGVDDDLGGQSNFFHPLSFVSSNAPLALQAKIGGFAADLRQQQGSVLSMQTLGSSPNRTLVVQFAGYREHTSSGESIDFQIRLRETSNIVEVVYGNMTITGSFGDAEVGLRGSAASSDFNMRDINSPNTWATSIAGTNVSATADYLSMQPNPGQTYRWSPPPACSSSPAANAIVSTSSLVCPVSGSSQMSLVNSYTVSGISYQWQSSTASNVGPYTSISNQTDPTLSTPSATATTWYRLLITCSNGSPSTTLAAVQVNVAGTTTNTAPYFEGFEGPGSGNNQLPNCSWSRSDTNHCKTANSPNFSNRTPRTGIGYANFDSQNGSGSTFRYFSNGIKLNAGVTYSAAVWFIGPGFTGFTNFALSYATNQNASGLTLLANAAAPSTGIYSSLSNTFTVASSGMYYMVISAKDNFSGSFLTFDDLSVTIPCSISQNQPNMLLSAPPAVCSGQSTTLTANGANTYTWNTGAASSSIVISPTANAVYSVSGTSTLSGCISSLSSLIYVNPLPPVYIFPSPTAICAGSSANLTALGANSYTWSNGLNTPMISVTPGTTTVYSVTGANSSGCAVVVTQTLVVNPAPSISITGNTLVCIQGNANLTAHGASSYTWMAGNLYLAASAITPQIFAPVDYTVTGTDANGCSATATVSLKTTVCTGLALNSAGSEGLSLFPNPTAGEFTFAWNNGLSKQLEVLDVTGRIVLTATTENDQSSLSISSLANGIYYVRITSGPVTETVKLIKN